MFILGYPKLLFLISKITFLDELDERHVIKNERVALDRLRV